MTTARTPMTHHPLVDAYLADLDRSLAGADPRERAETLAAVREHIDEALQERPDAVREVLAELGPVDAIAASTTPAPAPRTPSRLPAVTLLVAVVGLAVLVVNPFVAVPLALTALVLAVVQLRRHRPRPALSWAALVVAAATLLAAALLALTLLPAGVGDPVPSPVQTAGP